MKPFNILCIFHKENNPSLRIWNNGNYFCHGCGNKGNVENQNELKNIFDNKIYSFLEQNRQIKLW